MPEMDLGSGTANDSLLPGPPVPPFPPDAEPLEPVKTDSRQMESKLKELEKK